MKRRAIVEIAQAGETLTVDYDGDRPRGLEEAVRERLWSQCKLLAFDPIKDEEFYEGWSRFTVNVSGPICTGGDAGSHGAGCWNELDAEEADRGDLCFECRGEVPS